MAKKAHKNEAQIRAEMTSLREQLSVIEEFQRRQRNDRLVGKAFRYRNCYSCPEKESDYWWLYAIVDGLDDGGNPRGWTFQRDKDGSITVEQGRVRVEVGPWREITSALFYAEFDAIVTTLQALRVREFHGRQLALK